MTQLKGRRPKPFDYASSKVRLPITTAAGGTLMALAKSWFQQNGYEVGPPLIWSNPPEGNARSDFRVTHLGESKPVAVLIIPNEEAARSKRLEKWLRIQRSPGVYIVNDLLTLYLVHSCPTCFRKTRLEVLTVLDSYLCPHSPSMSTGIDPLTVDDQTTLTEEEDQVDYLYKQIVLAGEAHYPGDLDAGMKVTKDDCFEIKPLHFGRFMGLQPAEVRKIVGLAGGYPAYDRYIGRREKVWKIPRRRSLEESIRRELEDPPTDTETSQQEPTPPWSFDDEEPTVLTEPELDL